MACSAPSQAQNWEATGAGVITYQRTNRPAIASEIAGSADLILTKIQLSSSWVLHLEAASSLDAQRIASNLPEANTDAGSALNKDGKGRLQLSELYYQHRLNSTQQISAGLVDISGFFEQSRIASDEATQFLGTYFTGNPLIEFPDYTLGVVYEHELAPGTVLRAGVSSSNGLADNSARSYNQVLSLTEKEKGVFAITSLSWRNQAYLIRLGAWTNTADHKSLDLNRSTANNYGLYLLTGYQTGNHAWNMRLGLANEQVSKAMAFSSLGYQYRFAEYVFGIGLARAFLSTNLQDNSVKDTEQYELYVRYALTPKIYLTADLQNIVNSDFIASETNKNRSTIVIGLRLSWLFG
ncbi:carbohydrate porin [Brumicola nitratireducens]|uniref:Uncharacterized protein n=1 Tax=Glaciecola nitratireducens (strain JCM 12485 / KCTC 12276 / FR1064) TaxID=1085623 RepID=G4QHI7_GLANF|nr:carbohydrate porin [Glaciecola nitratireducens]AEP29973.1 hypothetical protein GNIT_1864 [Glaciecola nitratireducens FR1064]